MDASTNIAMSSHRQGTVPIVGLTEAQSTAFVTNVIFASICMGALAWEIIISLPFDWRLLRETKWRSIPSAIHSFAYYLSRYSTLAFIINYVVINATSTSVANDHVCQMRVTAAAAMFVISECSVLLVFILRTIALWNLNIGVTLILMAGWTTTLVLGIMIPANGKGMIIQEYCTWEIQGKWVGISMVTTAVTCVICLCATITKLNKSGWKGLYQSMAPPQARSIDAEDVSRLLIQRTTFFFIIMVISIVIGDVVYFSVNFFAWQLIAVPFYLMISSNLAGRIFRRSWKMTHSSKYNMPPSYFPTSWHDNNSNGSRSKDSGGNIHHSQTRLHTFSRFGSERIGSTNQFSFGPPLSPLDVSELPQHYSHLVYHRSDDNFSFVEGVFRSTNAANGGAAISVKSLSLPRREEGDDDQTPAELIAAQSRAFRRASEPAKMLTNMDRNDDTITPAYDEGGLKESNTDSDILRRDFGAVGIAETPTFMPRAQKDTSIRTQLIIRANSAGQTSLSGGGGGSRAGSGGSNVISPPPFGSAVRGSNIIGKKQSKRKVQKRPTTDPTELDRSKNDNQMNALDPHSNTIDSPRSHGLLSNGSPRPGTASSVVSDSRTQNSIPPNEHYKHANWSTFTMSSNAPSIGNGTPPTTSSTFPPNGLSRLRDDLAMISNRGKLWHDSSAERARMEAVNDRMEMGTIYQPARNGSTSYLSSNASSGFRTPPSSVGRSTHKSGNSKRLILSRASEAGDYLSARSTANRRRFSTSNAEPSSPSLSDRKTDSLAVREKTSRASFLTSPAIVSQTSTSNVWTDRSHFDLDAMQRSLKEAVDLKHDQTNQIKTVRSKPEIRPRTAPSKTAADAIDEVEDGGMEEDPLNAFRKAVDHDIQHSRRNSAVTPVPSAPPPFGYAIEADNIGPDNRPRTSRGGSFSNGSFPLAARNVGNRSRASSIVIERPKTRNGNSVETNGSTVKPFGYGLRIASSQQDLDYNTDVEDEGRMFSTPLERIDTLSTDDNHQHHL